MSIGFGFKGSLLRLPGYAGQAARFIFWGMGFIKKMFYWFDWFYLGAGVEHQALGLKKSGTLGVGLIFKGRCLAMITAEKIYKDIFEMPLPEREKLFATIARKGFEKDLYTHDEVFDDIRKSSFSLREAA